MKHLVLVFLALALGAAGCAGVKTGSADADHRDGGGSDGDGADGGGTDGDGTDGGGSGTCVLGTSQLGDCTL